MGLAGAKKRSKLSRDPNNTAWSKSTTTFGHKILTSQGWKPGDYLGAENATHSEHFTAANASHIRIMLREDNLGLGAQVGRGNAETFGLNMFSGILGRLNGKDEGELRKQEEARRDVELRSYQAQKYGFLNFVRGGLLVGDKIESGETMARTAATDTDKIKSRKRKLETSKQKEHGSDDNQRRDTRGTSSTVPEQPADISETSAADQSIRKKARAGERQEKERRRAERAVKRSKLILEVDDSSRSKAEKRARKEERRKRKEEKRLRKAAKLAPSPASSGSDSEVIAEQPLVKAEVAPPNLNRHAVRQRYIQQKRMASMDPQALKEIFMFQAPVS